MRLRQLTFRALTFLKKTRNRYCLRSLIAEAMLSQDTVAIPQLYHVRVSAQFSTPNWIVPSFEYDCIQGEICWIYYRRNVSYLPRIHTRWPIVPYCVALLKDARFRCFWKFLVYIWSFVWNYLTMVGCWRWAIIGVVIWWMCKCIIDLRSIVL